MDADLKQYLETMEERLTEHFTTRLQGLENGVGGQLIVRFEGLENRLVGAMRDMQTELLRAFAASSEDETIQLRRM